MVTRRELLSGLAAAASGLWLPYEPKRVYSFASPVAGPLDYWAWDVMLDGDSLGTHKSEVPIRIRDGNYHRVQFTRHGEARCEWQFKMAQSENVAEIDWLDFERVNDSRLLTPPAMVIRSGEGFTMRLFLNS
jgi:hypothetical protein